MLVDTDKSLEQMIKESLAMSPNQSFRFLEGKQLEKEVAEDVAIIQGCLDAIDKIPHIVVGEWVKNGDVYKQVAMVLDANCEEVKLQLGGGNCYLTEYGGSYSGLLEHPIEVKLKLTEEKKLGGYFIGVGPALNAACTSTFRFEFGR